jgi:UDP-N-acetylglucosamine--N-acetylmuramyl-(pentapeptide) pyrophosphoryl-undecaprenol N-acetylglucosamine transferase
MNASSRRVLIMAGGTGGHVFPGLAAAEIFRDLGVEVAWLGTRAGIESTLVPRHRIEFMILDVAGVRGQGLTRFLTAPFKVLVAVVAALKMIRQWQPDLVLGMGGFVTGPGGVAAWLARKPLFIHEQNAIPGLTNRLLAYLADDVFEAFAGAFGKKRSKCVGNPVRADIASLPEPDHRYVNRSGPVRILVLGGSQGAVALNETIPGVLHDLASEITLEIRHQAGARNIETTRRKYQELQQEAQVHSFIDDMAQAYGWADLVICRAGALTVSEVAAAGVAALFIPYPYAVDDHQTHNAQFLAGRGAALLMQQHDCHPAALAELLRPYLQDRQQLLPLAREARRLALPQAAENLVRQCLERIPA